MAAAYRSTLAVLAVGVITPLVVPLTTRAQNRATAAADACVHATVALTDAVDSANALAGDSFRFRVVDATTASDGTQIPEGAVGYGVISYADHAHRGGRGGTLVLEPRLVALDNGKRISVIGDRSADGAATTTGASKNAPSFLGAIPFVGYALGPYGFLHHGANVTLPAGTRLSVVVGDDLAMATCRLAKHGETPKPSPSPPARRQPQEQSASPSPSP